MRAALVTGATRGIGQALAAELATSGWRTYAVGRDRAALEDLRALCGAMPLALDLTDRDDLVQLAGAVTVETLIHAALRWPEGRNFAALSEAEIDMGLEVNLSVTLQLTRAILPSMVSVGCGEIVILLPEEDELPGVIGRVVASGLLGLAESLNTELIDQGISVRVARFNAGRFTEQARKIVTVLDDANE